MRVDHRTIRHHARGHTGQAVPVTVRARIHADARLERMRAAQMPGAKPGTQRPGQLVTDDYSYSTEIITIQKSSRTSTFITIEQDANFQILQRVYTVFDVIFSETDINAAVPVTVQMSDVSSSRVLSSVCMLSEYAGIARVPYTLGQRKILAAMQSVRFDFENLSDTTDYLLQLTLIGRKLFL